MELPIDVKLELFDPLFASVTHGKKWGYQKGCRGPLCRKAERDAKRREYGRRVTQEGARVRSRAPHPVRARDEELERITFWYHAQVAARKSQQGDAK